MENDSGPRLSVRFIQVSTSSRVRINRFYCSKLDTNSRFFQIPLAVSSRPFTTFITLYGQYQFNKLPFSITSAPEHFQHRMSQVLSDLQGVVCLNDDMLVHGRTKEEHDTHLRAVLERLEKAGVTLNAARCSFC